MFENKYDYLIINSSESTCWLLNVRGFDLPFTPIVLSRMIISKSDVKVFVDEEKIPDEVNEFKFKIYDSSMFEKEILKLPKKSNILLDEISPYYFLEIMLSNGFKPTIEKDPCELLRSQKNITEIKNAREAHMLDALSLVKYFFWLENLKKKSSHTELSASEKLESLRRESKKFFSASFQTISASGSSGSIIHYNPAVKPKKLYKGELYLCDSGGQYYGGTTDVTRTLMLGNKTKKNEYISNYTSVLKGHINLSLIKFPVGTKGNQLDSIARFYLWQKGLDYNHGTGHGVGSFLGVHEGPQSISKRNSLFELKEGMIVSNEPGFYKNEEYGIRIENLLLVKKSKFSGFLEFETLTLCPYEKDLIDCKDLANFQISWLNDYHSKVYKKLSKYLSKDIREWLYRKTEVLA